MIGQNGCALGAGLLGVAALAVTMVGAQPRSAEAADFGVTPYAVDDGYDTYDDDYSAKTRKREGYAPRMRHPQTLDGDTYSFKDDLGDRDSYADTDRYENFHSRDGYAGRAPDAGPYSGSYKDAPHQNDYAYQSPRHDRDRAHQRWRRDHACLPRRQLRRKLRRAGWRGFRHGRVRGNIGYVVARQRGTGEIYELAVDRCTGDVISAACIGPVNRGLGRQRYHNSDYQEDVVIRW